MSDNKVDCPACDGKGYVSFATEKVVCMTCDGKGSVTHKVATAVEKDSENT